MLSAINFNRKAQGRAVKVKRERPDWVLPSETKAVKLIAAQ
jgi:hypothetical protein